MVKNVLKPLALLTLPLLAVAFLGWITGFEAWLGRLLYDPSAEWAMTVRTDSVALMQAGLVACLMVVTWPFSHKRHAGIVRSCALVLLTAAFGCGLLNQTFIKESVERPRPRETGMLSVDMPSTNLDGFRGNSMPSGHAGFALLLAVPFIALRRERPVMAQRFLLAGSLATAIVGVSRMVLGAHYLSDVLVAAALTLGTAFVLDLALRRYGTPRPLVWLVLVLVVVGSMVTFNRFTMTYSMLLPTDFKRISLPCSVSVIETAEVTANPVLTLEVDAYGAPKSMLSVVNDDGVIRLDHGMGFFHTITCKGTLQRNVQD